MLVGLIRFRVLVFLVLLVSGGYCYAQHALTGESIRFCEATRSSATELNVPGSFLDHFRKNIEVSLDRKALRSEEQAVQIFCQTLVDYKKFLLESEEGSVFRKEILPAN